MANQKKEIDWDCSSDEELDSNVEEFTHIAYSSILSSNCEPSSSDFVLPDFPVPLSAFEHLPVGDRMRVAYPNWQAIGAHDYVVSILKNGYSLEFKSKPPLVTNPTPFYLNLSAEQQVILDDEMNKFIDGNVIEEVTDLSTPGFYSPLFLRPKTDKGWRIIINISELNKHLVYHKFKMETLRTVRQGLKKGYYAFSIDLKSAYSHLPIHPSSRKYLRFFWHNRCFQFRNLPFGLSPAPYIFSLTVSQVARYFHLHGVFAHCYLDDWQFFLFCQEILRANQPKILHLTTMLGWIINYEKSALPITQHNVYIGGDFNLELGMVQPTPKRWEKILTQIPAFQSLSVAKAGHWASIVGLLTSTQELTPMGRLHLRSLQFHLNEHWLDRENKNVLIPITPACRQALGWWLLPENVMVGVPLQPPVADLTLFTDSSNTGYGASLENRHFSGKWTAQQAHHHINYLEMLCVKLALEHFLPLLQGKVVLVASDNVTVVSYINKFSGTHSKTLHDLTFSMLTWCFQVNIQLRARHIPGKLNQIADGLSRDGRIIQTEWSLHPAIFRSICQTWHAPQVDLFATSQNNKCPVYFSPIPDTNAAGIDSLSQSWANVTGYAYPPPNLLQLVLNKVESTENCNVFLVVPKWPRRNWFAHLLRLLIDKPRHLPHWTKLLKQPNQHVFLPDPASLDLHVCSISSTNSLHKGFLKTLQTEWRTKLNHPPMHSTKGTGTNSVFGVVNGIVIPTIPLFPY